MDVSELAALIDPQGQHRTAGQGRLSVRCPAHEDRTPSLTVWVDDRGKAAFNCHAGCDHRQILDALPAPTRERIEATWQAPAAQVIVLHPSHTPRPPVVSTFPMIEAEYPYEGADGTIHYVVRRFEGKKYRQFHYVADKLVTGRGPAALIPYRLPDVQAAIRAGDPIWIVEGEKDADTLATYGLTATCNVGGAGKWTPELDSWFTDAQHVYILPDNDKPGADHARQVAEHLPQAVTVTLPDLPEKGDITDWLKTHSIEELQQVAAAAAIEIPAAEFQAIDLRALMTGDAPEEEWMAEPILPARKLVGLVSRRGEGKSLLTLDIAARKAAGRACLAQKAAPPIHVIYLDMEMGPEDLYDRLYSLGWHPDNPHFNTLVEHLHYYQLISLPPLDTEEGGLALEQLVDTHDAALVVVDTVSRVISGDENTAEPFRDLFRHTETRLKRRGITLLRLDHLGKDVAKGSRGSSAKEDPLDIVWHISQPIEDTLNLTLTKGRQDWVQKTVTIRKVNDNGVLQHEVPQVFAPDWLLELVAVIDELGVPNDAGAPTVTAALQQAGRGRKATVVRQAVKFRKGRIQGGPETGPTPGPPLRDHLRDHAGPPPSETGTDQDLFNGTTLGTTPDQGKGGSHPTKGGTTPDQLEDPY